MGPFMFSSVNVALPAIKKGLGMTAVQMSWVATCYLLTMAVVLIPAGKIADIHGRKKVFITGLIVYTIGSTAAAGVDATAWFLFLRVIQGVGAALFVTTDMAILASVFPSKKRGRAIGIYVAAIYVGLSVGPFWGGFLTQQFGWRSIFLIMLPFGAVSIFVSKTFLKGEWSDAANQRLDLVGCLIYCVAILSLTYGATSLPSLSGGSLFAAGIAGMILFFGSSAIRFFLFSRFPYFLRTASLPSPVLPRFSIIRPHSPLPL
jgi:MFS family permease